MPHGNRWPHPIAHDVQQGVQVADQGLHGSLGVLHRKAGEDPTTVIKGEVSALGWKQGQAKEPLGQRAWDTLLAVQGQKAIKLEDIFFFF